MSPLPQGGVSIFLYEYGIALIVPGSDPSDIQPVLQCQISPMTPKRSSHTSNGFSTGISEKIQSVKTSLQNVFDNQDAGLMSEPLTLFKEGQRQFHLLDYNSKKIVNVSTPMVEIQNISPMLPRGDSTVFNWVVTGKMTESNKLGHTLASYSTVTGIATLSELSFLPSDSPLSQFKHPFDAVAVWNLANQGKWMVEDRAIWSHATGSSHPASSRVVEWTGSTHSHLAAFSMHCADSDRDLPEAGKLMLWPRSEVINGRERTIIPGNNFAPSYVVNGLQSDERGSCSSFDV